MYELYVRQTLTSYTNILGQWAGGNVTYEKGPFTMVVKSVKVVNYSPGTEYRWMDKSGDFGSIEVVGAGNAEGAPQNTVAIEPSANATLASLESGVDAPTATGEATDGDSEKTPCECGTATVTVTGAPPPVTVQTPDVRTAYDTYTDFVYQHVERTPGDIHHRVPGCSLL
jgi:hypothetical protein